MSSVFEDYRPLLNCLKTTNFTQFLHRLVICADQFKLSSILMTETVIEDTGSNGTVSLDHVVALYGILL